MIDLNPQLCEELDLTFWQLNKENSQQLKPIIKREEKELLRKILLAKGITLNDEIMEVQEQGVVIVNVNNHQLVFNNVEDQDTINTTQLAKLSDMLNSMEHKKHTWHKLKNINL